MTMSNALMETLTARGLDVELLDQFGWSGQNRDGTDTIELIREVISYDPRSGILTWKARDLEWFPDKRSGRIWNTRYAGTEALSAINSNGYKQGYLFYQQVLAHRIAWAMYYGQWPINDIDHENGIKTANWIENLRAATPIENARNQKRSVRNSTGRTGVAPGNSGYVAYIRANGKRIHLGTFDSIAEASVVRAAAEREHGYHPNHGSVR